MPEPGCLGFDCLPKIYPKSDLEHGMGKFFEKAMDNLNIGFQDDDGFRSLEDARLNYFSKYSDSQLEEIYEVDARARDIIERIRKIRNSHF